MRVDSAHLNFRTMGIEGDWSELTGAGDQSLTTVTVVTDSNSAWSKSEFGFSENKLLSFNAHLRVSTARKADKSGFRACPQNTREILNPKR